MPRAKIKYKDVPDWDYPQNFRELMVEFEEVVEDVRNRMRKVNRNLVAGRNARTLLQNLKTKLIPALREKLFEERDRLEAGRHSMTVREWNAYKERQKAANVAE